MVKESSCLYFRNDDFTEVTNILDEKEIFWSHENLIRKGAPPAKLLELLAPVDELSCLRIAAKDDLVEELVAMFRGDTQKSRLEEILIELVSLGILVGLALEQKNQSERWLEWFALGGSFEKMIKLFSADFSSASEVFPAFGVLIITKPIVPDSQRKLFEQPSEE